MNREFTGKTTEDAINKGLSELGLTIADVRVEVIEEGAKGLFGLFGSRPAKVRIIVPEAEKENDDGLSDLLGSITLDSDQKAAHKQEPKKKEKKEAPAKEEPKQVKKEEAKAEKKEAPKPAAEAKPEKKEAPKPAAEAKPEKKEAPKPAAEVKPEKKEAPMPVEEKVEEPKPIVEAQPETETPEAAEGFVAEAAETAWKETSEEEKPRKEKKQREPKGDTEAKAKREVVDYVPVIEETEPFAPEGDAELLPEDTAAGKAQRFLLELTQRMNVEVQVYVTANEPDAITLHMIGDSLGILIGRRGETLDALQYLTSLQINKGQEEYIRVTVDSENYRAKREDSLRRLALRMANRAQKTGRRVVLEPMNPYERRVLHTTLQDHPAVSTHSEGEEPNRRVVIVLKAQPERANQDSKEKSGNDGRSRRHKNRKRGSRKRSGEPKFEQETIEVETVAQAQEAETEE